MPGAGWSCHPGKHRECCAGPPGAFARQCRCRRRSRPSRRCRARLCPRRRPPFHPRRRRRYHLRQPRHRYRLPRRRARERRCSRPRFASRPGAQASDSNYRVGDEGPRDHRGHRGRRPGRASRGLRQIRGVAVRLLPVDAGRVGVPPTPSRTRSSSPPPASAASPILSGCGLGFTRWPATNATVGCAGGSGPR